MSLTARPVSEEQHLAVAENVTLGTYQLRYNHTQEGQLVSEPTLPIAWNATPQAALQSLPGLAGTGLSVSQVSAIPSQLCQASSPSYAQNVMTTSIVGQLLSVHGARLQNVAGRRI